MAYGNSIGERGVSAEKAKQAPIRRAFQVPGQELFVRVLAAAFEGSKRSVQHRKKGSSTDSSTHWQVRVRSLRPSLSFQGLSQQFHERCRG